MSVQRAHPVAVTYVIMKLDLFTVHVMMAINFQQRTMQHAMVNIIYMVFVVCIIGET